MDKMIAHYIITTAEMDFCCENAECEKYIRRGELCVLFTEYNQENNHHEMSMTRECIDCAHEKIEDDMEERAMVLTRIEHSL